MIREKGVIMIYSAKRKKDNKSIKGYYLKIKNKSFLIKPKEITSVLRSDYIWLKGGSDEYEIILETLSKED